MKGLFILTYFLFVGFLFSEDFLKKHDFRNISDFEYFGDDIFEPNSVFDGAIIYIRTEYVDEFFLETFSKITKKHVVITYGDKGSPGEYFRYLEHPNMIAWFGTNPTRLSEANFFPIPIGLLRECPVELLEENVNKEYMLYMNMSIQKEQSSALKIRERNVVFNLFSWRKYCYTSPKKPFEEYLTDLKKSRFVLSPRGNGVDCHRTWEAIAMGSIPVVRSSFLDPLFKDLPVLIVKNWGDAKRTYLREKEKEIKDKKVNLEVMTLNYWIDQIEIMIAKANITRGPIEFKIDNGS